VTRSYIKILPLLLVIAGLIYPAHSETESTRIKSGSSLALIETAYTTGQITRADKIFYDMQAVLYPQQLPAEFKSDVSVPVRSGTPYINDVLDNWNILSQEQQAAAAAYFYRPPAHKFIISPDSLFMIHYDTSGSNTVPPEDADSSGIPDFVERIAMYADSSGRFYRNELGYLPPPSDSDAYYDIYIRFLGMAYGATYKELPGDSSWGDYSSYMEINNAMATVADDNEDPEGKVIGALKITCAHEFFHATQMAYGFRSGPDIWWTEGSATFMEDVVFDVVNDNYIFLPYFFNYPDTFLIDTSIYGTSWHDYSTFVWPTFLTEKYGIDIVRTIWEYIRFYATLPSMDSALAPFGRDVETAFPEFTAWNYFTGNRHTPDYYEEGVNYPLILIDHQITACPFSGDGPIYPPDGLASNYIVAYPNSTDSGLLKLNFDGVNIVQWGFSYIAFKNDTGHVVTNCTVDMSGRTQCGIYNYVNYDSIVFIPCVITQWQDDNSYTFASEVRPYGDANGDGDVNIFDVTHVISFLYLNGPDPKYDYLMGDFDCNGTVNILDVSYLITFLYLDGPEPCAGGPQ
jgi:hypothetical protein